MCASSFLFSVSSISASAPPSRRITPAPYSLPLTPPHTLPFRARPLHNNKLCHWSSPNSFNTVPHSQPGFFVLHPYEQGGGGEGGGQGPGWPCGYPPGQKKGCRGSSTHGPDPRSCWSWQRAGLSPIVSRRRTTKCSKPERLYIPITVVWFVTAWPRGVIYLCPWKLK